MLGSPLPMYPLGAGLQSQYGLWLPPSQQVACYLSSVDPGPGVAEDDRGRLFGRFERGSAEMLSRS